MSATTPSTHNGRWRRSLTRLQRMDLCGATCDAARCCSTDASASNNADEVLKPMTSSRTTIAGSTGPEATGGPRLSADGTDARPAPRPRLPGGEGTHHTGQLPPHHERPPQRVQPDHQPVADRHPDRSHRGQLHREPEGGGP